MAMYDIIRKAVKDVDTVNRSVSDDIIALVKKHESDRISLSDVRVIMKGVDRIIDRAYGLTPTRAKKSAIFLAIVRNTDLATETSFRTVYRSVRRRAIWTNPRRWIAIERAMRTAKDPFAETYMSLFGPDAQKRALGRSGLLDPDRRWVDPNGYKLSERVWQAGRKNRRAIDKVIRDGVRQGNGPVTIGRELEKYLHPKHAPVEYRPNGQIVRKDRYRRNPSGTSAARRLARTEVKHMSHVATTEATKNIHFLGAGVQWALSNAHPEIDICDTLARRNSRGYPSGVYTAFEFPAVPHPNCLCTAIPWLPPREQVLRSLEYRYLSAVG